MSETELDTIRLQNIEEVKSDIRSILLNNGLPEHRLEWVMMAVMGIFYGSPLIDDCYLETLEKVKGVNP